MQHAEQLCAVVGIRGVVAGETRSVHAGCATQGIDFKTGVVGHRRHARGRSDCAGFQAGIAEQTVGVFNNLANRSWARQQLHHVAQQISDLCHLVGVGRCANELFHARGAGGTAMMLRCRSNTWVKPCSARPSNTSNCSRENA